MTAIRLLTLKLSVDAIILAIACFTLHFGITVLVAASVTGLQTAVIVAAYILTAAAISIPYLRWRRGAGADARATLGRED